VAEQRQPYQDVRREEGGFSIPALKWRSCCSWGAATRGDLFARDPSRPAGPFAVPGLFAPGARFRVEPRGERVLLLPSPRG